MVNSQWTFIFASTLFQIFLCLIPHFPRFFVAVITEMVASKTEEEGNRTTESAFKVDELVSMFVAIGLPIISSFQDLTGTLRTYQLLWLVFELLLHFLFLPAFAFLVFVLVLFFVLLLLFLLLATASTLPMSAEVRLLALEAFIVVEMFECEFV